MSKSIYVRLTDVVPDGRLMKERESDRRRALQEVRRKIAIGLDQLDRGETVDGERAFRELLGERPSRRPVRR